MRASLAALFASLTLSVWPTGCAEIYSVPVETRAPAMLNMAPFSRVLVAGFAGTGVDEVDTNLETTRLLRSQLQRAIRPVKVVDAGPIPITDTALMDAGFWRRIGEEYPGALILTGSIVLSAETRAPRRSQEREDFDAVGRQVDAFAGVLPQLARILTVRLIFIDGRTGAVVDAGAFREEALYADSHAVPALASYFELMERIVPAVVGAVSDHKVTSARVLLQ